MGKFINQDIVQTVDSTIEGFKDRLNNTYYPFISEKPYTVTYYNINKEKSMVDTATGIAYDYLGSNCPFRFNKINGFALHGLEKILVNISTQDIGSEADPITGDATILPNTIVPYAGDFFLINHSDDQVLFLVNDAQSDTLTNGANVYKIAYKAEYVNRVAELESCVVEEYNYIMNNVGTSFESIIRSSDYDMAKQLDDALIRLRLFYTSVFYSDRVQSMIFKKSGIYFYDSYLTEFLIRTKILQENSNNFVYLSHQLKIPSTFSIDYEKSLFYLIEKKNKKKVDKLITSAYGTVIDSLVNIFGTRSEDYCEVIYDDLDIESLDPENPYYFYTFEPTLLQDIIDNNYKTEDSLDRIIVKYMNNLPLNKDDIESFEDIDFMNNKDLFYKLPVIIYIIEQTIKGLMSTKVNL